MKSFSRKGHATWTGAHRSANGSMTTESRLLNKAAFMVGRWKKTSAGCSPYELLATAHAGCFSMALGEELGRAGFKICDIGTTATVTLEQLESGWTMTQMQLDVSATVPRAAQCQFIDAAMKAKNGCTLSRLMKVNISMTAKLLPGPNGVGEKGCLSLMLPGRPNLNAEREARNFQGRKVKQVEPQRTKTKPDRYTM